MPQIDVTLPSNTFDDDHKEQLLNRLTQTLLKWEGIPPNSPKAPFAWAYLHETKAGDWAFGGKIAASDVEPRYRVAITVPEGAMDNEHKKGLIEEVTRTVIEIEGTTPGASSFARVTCYILEVPEGGYGVIGQVYVRSTSQT